MQNIQTLIHCMYHPLCPLRGNVKRVKVSNERGILELFQESTFQILVIKEEGEIFSSDDEVEEEMIEDPHY